MKNSENVENNLVALISKIGEKITFGRTKTFNYNGAKNFNYLVFLNRDYHYYLVFKFTILPKNRVGYDYMGA